MSSRFFKWMTPAILLFWTGLAFAAPRAVPVNARHQFDPTPEGRQLTHEFVIQNLGDSELNILGVVPSCSCVTHSFDRTIPPGGRGVIKISLDTDGYGGQDLQRQILVKTNDPDNKKLYLTVTCKVSSLVTVKPSTVMLSGPPGETLEAIVTINPAPDFNMKILGMTQKFNAQIKATLVEPEPGSRDWQIKITTYSDKADDLYDILTLKTDNPAKPRIKVRVYAIYMDKSKNSTS